MSHDSRPRPRRRRPRRPRREAALTAAAPSQTGSCRPTGPHTLAAPPRTAAVRSACGGHKRIM